MNPFRGSALLALASGADALAAFVVSIMVARTGGPEALGRLATATALLLVGVTATELGQNVVLTRRAASGHPGARAGLGASLLCKTVAALLLLPAALALWPAGEPRWGLAAALLILLLSSWSISATAVLRGSGRFRHVAGASALSAATAVAGVALVHPSDLAAVLAVLAVAQGAKAAAVFRALPPERRPERPEPAAVRDLLSETLPFAAVVGVSVAYFKADIVLLSAIAGAAEAGRYAAAVRMTEALKLVPNALGGALFPRLAAGDERELPRAAGVVCGLGAAVVLFSLVAGDSALAALFGAPFAAAAAPLRILSLTFTASSVNALLILVLYARRQERMALEAISAALVTNVLANLLWIPGHGADGSAAASLLSEVSLGLLCLRALRRRVPAALATAHAPETWA